MTKLTQAFLSVGLIISFPLAGAKVADTAKVIHAVSADTHVVPRNKSWVINSIQPYDSARGHGTADFSIEGRMSLFGNIAMEIYGKFDIYISKTVIYPMYIFEDSKITVLESRGAFLIFCKSTDPIDSFLASGAGSLAALLA